MDITDIFFRLKFPNTRRDAYVHLKTFLCSSNLSPLDVDNAVYYVVMHGNEFTDLEAYTVIDLALANALAEEKRRFLSPSRLATFKYNRVSSGLALCGNLKDVATRHGTYFRVLDLLKDYRLQHFTCYIFNAVKCIASQTMFTDKQYCKIADRAIASPAFSVTQKKYFQMWKEDRSRRTTPNDYVDHIPTYANTLSSSGSYQLCQDLEDPVCRQGAFLKLVGMVCNGRASESLDTSRSELFYAVSIVALRPEVFSDYHFLMLADQALYSALFTVTQKKIIRAWRDDKFRTTVQVASGNFQLHDLHAKPMDLASDACSTSYSKSPLFLMLREPTTCQEAYETVLELVKMPLCLPNYTCQLFNALRVIGSKPEIFSDEQFFTVVRFAKLNNMFSDQQKKTLSEMRNTELDRERIDVCKTDLSAAGTWQSTTMKESTFDAGSYCLPPQDVEMNSPRNTSIEHNVGDVDVKMEGSVQVPLNEAAEVHQLDTYREKNESLTSAVDSDLLGLWWKAVAIICSICGGFKSRRADF